MAKTTLEKFQEAQRLERDLALERQATYMIVGGKRIWTRG